MDLALQNPPDDPKAPSGSCLLREMTPSRMARGPAAVDSLQGADGNGRFVTVRRSKTNQKGAHAVRVGKERCRARHSHAASGHESGVGPLSRQMVGVSIVDLHRHGNVRERPQVSLYRRGVNHKAER